MASLLELHRDRAGVAAAERGGEGPQSRARLEVGGRGRAPMRARSEPYANEAWRQGRRAWQREGERRASIPIAEVQETVNGCRSAGQGGEVDTAAECDAPAVVPATCPARAGSATLCSRLALAGLESVRDDAPHPHAHGLTQRRGRRGMGEQETKRADGRLPAQVGYWSAILLASVLLVYLLSMIGLVFSHPARWTGVADYVAATSAAWQRFLTICELCVFLAAPLYLSLLRCIHEQARGRQRFLARMGVDFALIATVLSSINYFTQLGAVRLSIKHGEVVGLEHLIQVNTHSAMYGLAILGWTLFLGASSLLIAPVFSGKGLTKVIRWACRVNAFACLLGLFGYLLEAITLDLLYLGGMGTSMIVLSISSALYFKRRLSTEGGNYVAQAIAVP